MKVCFIAGTLGRGGAERQLFYMLRALGKAGVETSVLCLTRGEAFERPIKDLGVDVQWVGAARSRIARLWAIVNKIRNKPVDILQSSHFYTNIYAGAASRILGIPCIGAIRNDLTSEIAANGALGKWQLKLPGHIIANSQVALMRAKHLGIDPERLHFVGNVVDVHPMDKIAQNVKRDAVHILFVGRLVPQKNPELFIRLAARLVGEFPDRRLTFEVAGEGPLRQRLGQMASEIGFGPDQFFFAGVAESTNSLYKRADILVLTSDHEGTPNVILEAMAHGVPVVATRVGGVTEILDQDRGRPVESGDLDGLVSACAGLVRDPAQRRWLGECGKKYVAKNHSPANLEKSLSSIYAKLVEGKQIHAYHETY